MDLSSENVFFCFLWYRVYIRLMQFSRSIWWGQELTLQSPKHPQLELSSSFENPLRSCASPKISIRLFVLSLLTCITSYVLNYKPSASIYLTRNLEIFTDALILIQNIFSSNKGRFLAKTFLFEYIYFDSNYSSL